MKVLLGLVFVLGFLVPHNLVAAPEDDVKGVFVRFVVSQNAHDLGALGKLLFDSQSFLWITTGTTIWGREAALKRFETLYKGTWQLEPDTSSMRVMMLSDRSAQIFVPIVFTVGNPGQAGQKMRILMNQIVVKTKEGWRISSILPIPVPNR